MKKMVLNKDFVLGFLLNPGYKAWRYGLFFLLILTITANDVMSNVDYIGNTLKTELLEWSVYLLTIFGFVSANVFVLVPRYLLKGRVVAYFVSLFLFVVVMLSIIGLLQMYLMYENDHQDEIGSWLFVNFMSSFVSTGFLIAGSTSILLLRHWIRTNRRIRELESATLRSELDMLKNQINPHFLLNMLNNVNVLIWKNPAEARRIVYELENLLKYQLRKSQQDEVPLLSDIRFIEDYLNLEKIRRDAFVYTIEKEGDMSGVFVPPLLFIPFVENAVKHNSDTEKVSYVHISFRIADESLYFRCENSKPANKTLRQKPHQEVLPITSQKTSQTSGGLGLYNIRRRLALLYPDKHRLKILDEEMRFVVELRIVEALKCLTV